VLDPKNAVSSIINDIFSIGAPEVAGELPSEFTRPWRFPLTDNQGDAISIERPSNVPGPFTAGMNANALFGSAPGTKVARDLLESAKNEIETIRFVISLLGSGQHMGDPRDYSAYLMAKLTRTNLKLNEIPNFNLDADRGYAYLCWDWLRDKQRKSIPSAFKTDGNPAHEPVLQHVYPTPVQPGYGWQPDDQVVPQGQVPQKGFNPLDPQASARIRYIERENKFQ